jgi:hypothetical protein
MSRMILQAAGFLAIAGLPRIPAGGDAPRETQERVGGTRSPPLPSFFAAPNPRGEY